LAFLSKAKSIKTIRDYSEWLNAVFDQEIQSKHFGNSHSLLQIREQVSENLMELLSTAFS
jgi:hypothetical protein